MVPQGHLKTTATTTTTTTTTTTIQSFVIVISQTRTQRYLCVLGVRELRLGVRLRRARGLMGRGEEKIAALFFLRAKC